MLEAPLWACSPAARPGWEIDGRTEDGLAGGGACVRVRVRAQRIRLPNDGCAKQRLSLMRKVMKFSRCGRIWPYLVVIVVTNQQQFRKWRANCFWR